MSVAASVQLPDQPTTGFSSTRPLGGSGIVAPHNEQRCQIGVAGDASGNVASLTVQLDPRYASLVAFLQLNSTSQAAYDVEFLIQETDGTVLRFHKVVPAVSVIPAVHACFFTPPPVLLSGTPGIAPPSVDVVTDNVNGATLTLNMQVYTFVKNVRELTPLPTIYSCLPRGVSIVP